MVQQNGQYLPARPGNIKTKCLIWANHPICARFEQSEQFPLNYETLKSLPDYIKNKATALPNVDGVWLREKIVYKSNFLRIKGELLETYRTDIQAYFDQTKYPTVLQPVKGESWIPHHMWQLDGDIFNIGVLSPSEIAAGTTASKDPHFSRWNHEVVTVPTDDFTLDAAIQNASATYNLAQQTADALKADQATNEDSNVTDAQIQN